jgi:hypothetical protein
LVATIGRLIRKKNMMLTIFVKGKHGSIRGIAEDFA